MSDVENWYKSIAHSSPEQELLTSFRRMAGDETVDDQLEFTEFKGTSVNERREILLGVLHPSNKGHIRWMHASNPRATGANENVGLLDVDHVPRAGVLFEPHGAPDRRPFEKSDVLKNHTTAPKSEASPQAEKAHNRTMTDVTRAELDAKFELLDTKLGARIQQAVDAMQARDEVHKHALEKAQAEFVSRDALYAEMVKRQDLSTEKLKSEMGGRDAVYAEIAKRQELAAEKFREEMAGRDAVAAERARAHELIVQKALAEAAGREAVMDQRLKNMDGEIAKMGEGFRSVKANIWFGVATIVAAVGATVAIAIGSFDSGRETSKAIAESTVKLEQLIKAQEAKAAAPTAPATPGAATPVPAATPESPAAK